jgi:hypothetical protein
MRRLIKFLHTMGSIGFMGSLATVLFLARLAPPPSSISGYALIRSVMAEVAAWIVLPSIALTLIPGVLAIAATRAFHNAGWAWLKAATGVLIFAGGLHALAPIQEEARLSAEALAGRMDPATLTGVSGGEIVTLWLLLAVSTANVALGVWRPRLSRSSRQEAAAATSKPGYWSRGL